MNLPGKAKAYVGAIILLGAAAFLWAMTKGVNMNWNFAAYVALAAGASVVKIRLHGLNGSFNMNFLFLLAGVTNYSVAETVIACCIAPMAGNYFNSRTKSQPIQYAFNMANLVLSTVVAYGLAHGVMPNGAAEFRPAWYALIMFTYFVFNTLLVSGILSLVSGKKLADVNGQFYLWGFPYYLVGSTLVGLLPLGSYRAPAEAWLVMAPMLYMLHFLHGLDKTRPQAHDLTSPEIAESVSVSARLVLAGVMAIGTVLVGLSLIYWTSADPVRFAALAALGVAASLCKVRLPGVRGTMSFGFVITLFAVAELTLPEVVLIAALMSGVQAVLNYNGQPVTREAGFSVAAVIVSAAAAALVCRWLLVADLAPSTAVVLFAATVVLYCCNSLIIGSGICLSQGLPLTAVFERFYFWGLPYYMVGTAAAGLMVATARTAGWAPSLLVMPLMALVYYSYNMHVKSAAKPA